MLRLHHSQKQRLAALSRACRAHSKNETPKKGPLTADRAPEVGEHPHRHALSRRIRPLRKGTYKSRKAIGNEIRTLSARSTGRALAKSAIGLGEYFIARDMPLEKFTSHLLRQAREPHSGPPEDGNSPCSDGTSFGQHPPHGRRGTSALEFFTRRSKMFFILVRGPSRTRLQ